MNVLAKLTGFLVALAAVFGVAYLTGTQSQVLLAPVAEHADDEHAPILTGLGSTAEGYALSVDQAALQPGPAVPVRLRITGPDGRPVVAYDTVDDARLHLIAVRRDLTGYQHVYPELTDDGWLVPLALTSGPWRLLVDFQPTDLGRELTLAADLTVRGTYVAAPAPLASDRVQVDGYDVTMSGRLTTGPESALSFHLTRAGRPVTDLETFHASPGHAVILRPSDFGYLHLHPGDRAGATGPDLRFTGAVPEPGSYRMFVEFHTGGRPHAALFTVQATR
ncbi:MAG: hypothetical protein ABWY56_09505 [Propionibacteriaceae bacterium]